MKNKLVILALVFIFALIACGKVDSSKNKAGGSIKGKMDNSSLVPFDITTEKLPPNFKGTDIVKLYPVLLKKAPLEKEEFETTANYRNKIISAVTDDVYAFTLDPVFNGIGYGLRIEPYNADTHKWNIHVYTMPLSEYEDEYIASINLKSTDRSTRSYIGTNAFGAKVLIKSNRSTDFGIALVNQNDFGKGLSETKLSKSVRKINFSLDMPTEKAKTLKDNIGVLLLCKTSLYELNGKRNIYGKGNGLISEDTDIKKATIDDPIELLTDRKFINVKMLSIWVYEINTGSVLLKYQLKK